MRRALLLAAAALLAAACDNSSLTYPSLQDPSPFEGQTDGAITTPNGLTDVPTGQPVMLSWAVSGFTPVAWTLVVPAGSTAMLDDPASPTPSFTPDVGGVYTVTGTAMSSTATSTQSLRITAGAYEGLSNCAACHPETASLLGTTEHANTVIDDGSVLFGTAGCWYCHVVNPVPPPAPPAPGSFDAEAAAAGFDPAAYTTWSAFVSAYPAVADRANVTCEDCHGPGSEHDADPRKISVTLRETLCGTCHNGTVGPNRAAQWSNSAHGNAPRSFATSNEACMRCHTARAYLQSLRGESPEGVQPGAPGVTCAACHDPHDGSLPAQLRLFGMVPLASGGAYNAGRAASCFVCHQGEVTDAAAWATAGGRFPFAVQADMIATRGAVGFGYSYTNSFHASTVFRLRPFTGNPDDSDTPDSCVICHMAPSPVGPFQDELGEHTWNLAVGATELVAGNCSRCHPTYTTTFDVNRGEDWTGDGLTFGVQTEVRGLLAILYSALTTADVNGGLSRPGGPGTKIIVDPDLTLTTPTLRQAAYNYNFVTVDGSYGIHNTNYTVRLLQKTYGEVTGVPFEVAFPDADLR